MVRLNRNDFEHFHWDNIDIILNITLCLLDVYKDHLNFASTIFIDDTF